MNEKETLETRMMRNDDDAQACARAEDLVTYLYGEADARAAQSFEAHAQGCASCRTELAQFGHMRASIAEWRKEALGSLPSTVAANSTPVIAPPALVYSERRPSALAAIREFFTLSPAWLRAATAALVVVFCALVALTIARSLEQPETITVERIVSVKPSDAELDELIKARLKENSEAIARANGDNQVGPTVNNASLPGDQPARNVNRASKPNAATQTNLARSRAPQLKISPQESREIARDLRLVAANDEEDLPRLTDLIDEAN
ncbi:MAG TPA: zf-HC2 domain-containing protein [Pyrinomonadaceae bacterium]|jgi:hypothetical protein